MKLKLPPSLVFDPAKVARTSPAAAAAPPGLPAPAAAPASYNLDPNARFELWERDLRVDDPNGGTWELPVATTAREWGGVDVYIPEAVIVSGSMQPLQVSVYALAFGRRHLVGSGIVEAGSGNYVAQGAQLVASVRGLAARWEVVVGAQGDTVNPTLAQLKVVLVAHDAVTAPAEGVGVVRATTPNLNFLTRPARAYAVRAVAPIGAVALQLHEGFPVAGTVAVWAHEVTANAVVSLVPPEWAQIWLNRPTLVWSTAVFTAVGPTNLVGNGVTWSIR